MICTSPFTSAIENLGLPAGRLGVATRFSTTPNDLKGGLAKSDRLTPINAFGEDGAIAQIEAASMDCSFILLSSIGFLLRPSPGSDLVYERCLSSPFDAGGRGGRGGRGGSWNLTCLEPSLDEEAMAHPRKSGGCVEGFE